MFWKADKIVCYSDHGLNNRHYRASEYCAFLSVIQVPLEYRTIIRHPKSRQVKVLYSDVYAIKITTVFKSLILSTKLPLQVKRPKILYATVAYMECNHLQIFRFIFSDIQILTITNFWCLYFLQTPLFSRFPLHLIVWTKAGCYMYRYS